MNPSAEKVIDSCETSHGHQASVVSERRPVPGRWTGAALLDPRLTVAERDL